MPKPSDHSSDPEIFLRDCEGVGLPSSPDYHADFVERMLSITPTKPDDDLKKLCTLWCERLGAKWVWLWLYYQDSGFGDERWEVAALASDGQVEQYLPHVLTPTEWKSDVVTFASALERPVFVNDIAGWSRTFEGREYRCDASVKLESYGCKSLLCIPVLFATGAVPSAVGLHPLKAVICAYYPDLLPAKVESERWLSLMGRQSAQFIAASFNAEQQRILAIMNTLAQEYLTRKSGAWRVDENRRYYLNQVIVLLQQYLSVDYVTVFYRNLSRDAITAVATTGLWDANGSPVEDFRLSSAIYKKGESVTGMVFDTGTPFKSDIGEPHPAGRYKWRESPEKMAEPSLPFVVWPIFAPLQEGKSKNEVLGIIRLVGNRATFALNRPRNFDPIQLRTLDFIARMLAPVLETMTINIERERTISIIKHDLFSPLKMMEDTIRHNSAQMEKGKEPSEYFLKDLAFCIWTITNLVSFLDQTPAKISEFNPRPTMLEGDVVAGVQEMLNHYARAENMMSIRFEGIREMIPRLNIDRVLVSRALCNLIVNAIKYGESGTQVLVEARTDNVGYYLDVSNHGIGVGEDEVKQLFQEGYRSPVASRLKMGLGMGLALARSIMRKHEGDLVLTSAKSPTVFSMIFPHKLKC